MTTYQSHPAAEIFPLMEGAEFDALVADIKEHSLRETIILHEGMILDGRNRYRACKAAGVRPIFENWAGGGSPQEFVVSMNLHRRHLNESQRAMIAARLATLKRGDVASQRSGLQICSSTAQEAADLLNVGISTVYLAKNVLKEGTAEEIKAAESGETTVSTIAKEIRKKTPPEERKAKRAAPLAQAGKNPERIQRAQMHAEIWAQLSEALLGLSGLPLPSDVAEIVAANHNRTRLVEERLARALQWLKEFEHEWSNRDQAAA